MVRLYWSGPLLIRLYAARGPKFDTPGPEETQVDGFKKKKITNIKLYLFSEAVVGIRRHPCGNVEDGFHGRGSVVGGSETGAAVPLKASHETTVSS